jgi:hypothetical protein
MTNSAFHSPKKRVILADRKTIKIFEKIANYFKRKCRKIIFRRKAEY